MHILIVNLMLKPWWFSIIFLSVILIHSIMFPLVDGSEGATHKMISDMRDFHLGFPFLVHPF